MVAAGLRVRHAVARAAGLGESELAVLEALVAGPLGPAELARRLEVSTAASTGIVDRLAERGHVVRRPHDGDRRRTEVHLTDSGRAEIRTHMRAMFRALDRLGAEFDAGERAVIVRYLRGAARAFVELEEAVPPRGRRRSPPA